MNWNKQVLLAALLMPLTALAAINTAVQVSGGALQGIAAGDAITVFKGIPFAAPPVGNLRWRAPQSVPAWEGIRKADQFGDSCIQKIVYERKPWTHEFMAHNDISEDCLYLNVWTPARSSADRLPVYVYIHGGGNVEGSGAVPVYDGAGLASKGVVVVNINYRLGIFGFFAHPELSAETSQRASGNYANQDVIAALKWVRQNIAQFGGDPGRVTIGGQSAGSGHVHGMVASPLAKGLFHGAINESGANINLEQIRSMSALEQQGVAFAQARGVQSLAELRRLSWQEITDPLPGNGAGFRWGAVIDNHVFTAGNLEILAQGRQNDVPTITGTNAHEYGALVNPNHGVESYTALMKQRYAEMADEVLKLYPAGTAEQANAAVNQASRDHARTNTNLWARHRGKTAKTPVYAYFWTHVLPGPDAGKYGAFHTSEVPYVMNTLGMSDRPFTAQDAKIADLMSSYWANFIKTGNPNGSGLPHWPSVGEKPGFTMEVGDKFAPIPIAQDPQKQAFMEKYLRAKPRGQVQATAP